MGFGETGPQVTVISGGTRAALGVHFLLQEPLDGFRHGRSLSIGVALRCWIPAAVDLAKDGSGFSPSLVHRPGAVLADRKPALARPYPCLEDVNRIPSLAAHSKPRQECIPDDLPCPQGGRCPGGDLCFA